MPAIIVAILEVASALWGLTKILAVLGILYALFVPGGNKHVAQFVSNVVKGVLGVATPLLTDLETDLAPIVRAFTTAMTTSGKGIAADLELPLRKFAHGALDAASTSLEGRTNIKPSDWKEIASTAFADAAAFGLGSFAVSAAFEAVFPEKLNTLNSLGPMLATLSGFAEVTDAALRPLFYAGIAQPARYDANSKFRSLLPDLMHASVMYSRRQIDLATYGTLLACAGLSPDYVTPMTSVAYRPIQPRALATAIQDTAFPTDTMREILEDNALSPEHVNFYLEVLEVNSTRNVRNSYITEALTAYGAGVVSDTELDQILSGVNWSDTAKQLAKNRALLQRRVLLAKEVEASVLPMVAGGYMTPDAALHQLESAGVQDWLATLKITLAETKATIAAAKKAASLEAKLVLQRERAATQAAIKQFQDGAIDTAGLALALAAAGLDPIIVASTIAVQTAIQAGRLRWVYGQLLDLEDAKVLTDRVDAIQDQFKAGFITADQAIAQLIAWNVDGKQRAALIAKWSASAHTATPAGVLLSPLTGQPPT